MDGPSGKPSTVRLPGKWRAAFRGGPEETWRQLTLIGLRWTWTSPRRQEHQIIAGADALLMPSLYEPCGLTQMRAMRYGTPPLARRVGGLDDTIEDGTTGLLFDDYKPERLDWIVERAVFRYRKPASWQDMAEHGMAQDFSWDRVVGRYFEIYDRAFEVRSDSLAG